MAKASKKLPGKGRAAGHTYSYGALLILLILTLGATVIFYRSTRNRDSTRFNSEVTRIRSGVSAKVDVYMAMLNSSRAFIESTGDLDRKGFAAYVTGLEINKNFQGVRGLGFIRAVKGSEVDPTTGSYTMDGRKLMLAPFAQKETYFPVIFAEPEDEDSRSVIGFDVETDPDRWAVMQQARDSGDAVASGRLRPLASTREGDAVVVIFLPIYKRGLEVDSIDDRRANLSGFLFTTFEPDRFLREVEKTAPNGDVAVSLYDGDDQEPRALLSGMSGGAPADQSGAYESVSSLNVAGHEWMVQYRALPKFSEQSSVHWTPVIFFVGVGVSFLLFGMTHREAYARTALQATALDLLDAQREVSRLLEEEKRSRLAAERASRAKDEFLAVLSHELRTPLNAIAGWTRILRVGGVAEETRRTALEKIERNLRQQTGIVDELLTFSDAMSRGTDFSGTVSVRGAFEKALETVGPAAAEKGVEIEVVNELENHSITGETDLFAKAIENLLSNAIKFSPPGGHVKATARPYNDSVVFEVRDNGEGIAANFLPHVFEQYTQADHAYTRRYGGLGLGLPIAGQIIKLHGGEITAQSEGPGRGAVFTIEVPLHSRPEPDRSG